MTPLEIALLIVLFSILVADTLLFRQYSGLVRRQSDLLEKQSLLVQKTLNQNADLLIENHNLKQALTLATPSTDETYGPCRC